MWFVSRVYLISMKPTLAFFYFATFVPSTPPSVNESKIDSVSPCLLLCFIHAMPALLIISPRQVSLLLADSDCWMIYLHPCSPIQCVALSFKSYIHPLSHTPSTLLLTHSSTSTPKHTRLPSPDPPLLDSSHCDSFSTVLLLQLQLQLQLPLLWPLLLRT